MNVSTAPAAKFCRAVLSYIARAKFASKSRDDGCALRKSGCGNLGSGDNLS
jgi:hypothetical protein